MIVVQFCKPAVWLRVNYKWLLILSCLPLFATKAIFSVPIAVMGAIGSYRLIRDPHIIIRDPLLRMLWLCFLCFWIPMLASLPDAVNVSHASRTVFSYLRFPLAGIFVIQELRNPQMFKKLMLGTFAIVAFWCLDGLLQFFRGSDLFGYPYDRDQLAGMFYPKMRIGHVTATLAPIYFESVRRYSKQYKFVWVLLIPLFVVIFLSGKRAAWVMLAVACIGYSFLLIRKRASLKALLLSMVMVLATLGLLVTQDLPVRERIDSTAGLLSEEYETVDSATSYRLSLWETAYSMASAHWFNGVGPRGYRYVYSDHAKAGDFWLKRGSAGPTHPHQMLLEIAAETGMIGALGYLLFWLVIAHHFLRSSTDLLTCSWLLGAMIAIFPLNVHMAFYGTYWSSIFWWLMSIALATTARNDDHSPS